MLVMAEAQELDDFIREITEESPVARNIKNQITSEIPPLKNCSGFRITR